ncbi:hypothetical protein Tco_0756051 [Tanacetum coccineum]
MAPLVHRLSSYESQRLVRLFDMLSRKNAKLAEIKNDKMQIIDGQLKDDDKLPEYTVVNQTSRIAYIYRLLENCTGNTKCNPDLRTAKKPRVLEKSANMLPVVCKNCKLTPQLHESAGGLPSLKLSLHSCSLPGSTNAMGIETSIALVLPAREHECDTSFVLGRPPALS